MSTPEPNAIDGGAPDAVALDPATLVLRHLSDGVSGHRPEIWDEIMHVDFVMHVGSAGALVKGRKTYQTVLGSYWTAFPDLSLDVLHVINGSPLVAAHYLERGTQTGAFYDWPASGRSYAKNGLGIYRVEAGQLIEAWIQEDDLGFARQLGLDGFGY